MAEGVVWYGRHIIVWYAMLYYDRCPPLPPRSYHRLYTEYPTLKSHLLYRFIGTAMTWLLVFVTLSISRLDFNECRVHLQRPRTNIKLRALGLYSHWKRRLNERKDDRMNERMNRRTNEMTIKLTLYRKIITTARLHLLLLCFMSVGSR